VTEQEPPDEPRSWQYFGLTWNEADAKSVIITVGGTIAGGLVLVIMVGLALALAHVMVGGKYPISAWSLLLFLSLPTIVLALNWPIARSLKEIDKSRRIIQVALTAFQALVVLALLQFLLILVGVAAGIH
jgi:hypothetical protein